MSARRDPAGRGVLRTALSVLGRTAWALVVLALVAGAAVTADRLPGERAARVEPRAVAVPPSAAVLVCPGALRLATEEGGDVAYDPAFDPTPRDATSDLVALTVPAAEAAGPATVTRLDGSPLAELGGTRGALGHLADLPESAVVRAAAVGETSPWAAAGTAWRAGTGDLRGLAAASCQRPAAGAWLVGGSTQLGSSSRLVLQNAGATPATVTVRLWGAGGPLEPAGPPDYLVPPGTERVVLLEGLAAEQSQLVAEVSATGGLVTAYVQDSRTRGLVAAGVDLVVGGAAPATTQVVPAISVDADAPEAPLLRVLAPDDAAGPAVVDVALLGPDGVVRLPGTEGVRVDAGEVVDVPLDGLPPGEWTAWVRADVPVVAGAMVTRQGVAADGEPGGGSPVERAWAPAVSRDPTGPIALPGDEPGRLVVATVPGAGSVTPAQVTVDALDASGAVVGRREVAVPAGSTLALELDGLVADDAAAPMRTGPAPRPAAVVLRSDDARVVWAAVLDTGARVAVLAPVPPAGARPEVPVVVR